MHNDHLRVHTLQPSGCGLTERPIRLSHPRESRVSVATTGQDQSPHSVRRSHYVDELLAGKGKMKVIGRAWYGWIEYLTKPATTGPLWCYEE